MPLMPLSGGMVMATLAAALAGGQASAQTTAQPGRTPPRTTSELAEICAIPPSSPDHTAASYFCRGFLAGVAQYHGALHPVGGTSSPLFCVPSPPPRLADAVTAYVAWAQANSQFGGEAAVDGLMRFAQLTYPCPPQPAQARRRRGE